MNLTPEQLSRLELLRAHAAEYQAAWNRHAAFDRKGGSSATPEQHAKIIAETIAGRFTNELRSELEVLEFILDEPSPVFAYPSTDRTRITNFMGTLLASVTYLGPLYEGGFHGTYRQTFRASGINGRGYFGTIYGTYCRMRATRPNHRA